MDSPTTQDEPSSRQQKAKRIALSILVELWTSLRTFWRYVVLWTTTATLMGRKSLRRWSLSRANAELAEAMVRADVGESSIISKVQDLDKEISAAKSERRSTRSLVRERRTLLTKLPESLPKPVPATVSAEAERIAAIEEAIADLDSRVAEARPLLPTHQLAWRRVAVGAASCVFCVWATLSIAGLLFPTSGSSTGGPTSPDISGDMADMQRELADAQNDMVADFGDLQDELAEERAEREREAAKLKQDLAERERQRKKEAERERERIAKAKQEEESEARREAERIAANRREVDEMKQRNGDDRQAPAAASTRTHGNAGSSPVAQPSQKTPPDIPGQFIISYQGKSLTVEEWTKFLANKDADARTVAAWALNKGGIKAAAATPALVVLVGDANTSARYAAVRALQSVAPNDKKAIAATARALKDEDYRIRVEAATYLRGAGPSASTALPSLVEALTDTELNVRKMAAWAIAEIGPTADLLPDLLSAFDSNEMRTPQLGQAIARIGRPAVSPLAAKVKSGSPSVREEAAKALGEIGPDASDAIPILVEELENSGDGYLVKVLLATGPGDDPDRLVPLLIRKLGYPYDTTTRELLKSIGPVALPHLTRYIEMNRDLRRDTLLMEPCIECLGLYGEKGASTVSLLRELLQKKQYRQNAAIALGDIGKTASPAVADLIGVLVAHAKEVGVRYSGILGNFKPYSIAIAKIGDPALPELKKTLANDQKAVRLAVIECLANMADYHERLDDAVQVLGSALEDEEQQVRVNAARTLGYYGKRAESAIPKLKVAAENEFFDEIRGEMNFAIRSIETAASR